MALRVAGVHASCGLTVSHLLHCGSGWVNASVPWSLRRVVRVVSEDERLQVWSMFFKCMDRPALLSSVLVLRDPSLAPEELRGVWREGILEGVKVVEREWGVSGDALVGVALGASQLRAFARRLLWRRRGSVEVVLVEV